MNTINKDDNYYLYKAKKYHYKIQKKLKSMQQEGKTIPSEYKFYLKDFNTLSGGDSLTISDAFNKNMIQTQKLLDDDMKASSTVLENINQELQSSINEYKAKQEESITKINSAVLKRVGDSFEEFMKTMSSNNKGFEKKINGIRKNIDGLKKKIEPSTPIQRTN
jgi:predicted  nucleic acid-binding Zn-ribbon protein